MMHPANRFGIVVRLLAAAALVVSTYLLFLAMSGRTTGLGCGGGSGCSQVLASRWSKVLGTPVSLYAVGVYGLMTLLLILPPPPPPPGDAPRERLNQRSGLLALLAAAAIAGGVWFTALQVVTIGEFCRFCMAAHLCGGLASAVILYRCARSAFVGTVRRALLGTALVGMMMTLQVIWPTPTAQILRGGSMRAAGDQYVIEVGQGEIRLNPSELPIMGAPDAKRLLLLLYDYTCPHCRRMHQFLQQAERRYGEQLGVVMLPMPLDADCNPTLDHTEPRHEHACEYAELALAVWRADRGRYHDFDHWLNEGDDPPDVGEARRKAVEIIGEQALARALADDWPRSQIGRNVGLHQALSAAMGGSGGLPLLLSGGVLVAGRTHDASELFAVLEAELGLTVVNPVEKSNPPPADGALQ